MDSMKKTSEEGQGSACGAELSSGGRVVGSHLPYTPRTAGKQEGGGLRGWVRIQGPRLWGFEALGKQVYM